MPEEVDKNDYSIITLSSGERLLVKKEFSEFIRANSSVPEIIEAFHLNNNYTSPLAWKLVDLDRLTPMLIYPLHIALVERVS